VDPNDSPYCMYTLRAGHEGGGRGSKPAKVQFGKARVVPASARRGQVHLEPPQKRYGEDPTGTGWRFLGDGRLTGMDGSSRRV
jgi:hypothetical protein